MAAELRGGISVLPIVTHRFPFLQGNETGTTACLRCHGELALLFSSPGSSPHRGPVTATDATASERESHRPTDLPVPARDQSHEACPPAAGRAD
jgi:hypothetical protein